MKTVATVAVKKIVAELRFQKTIVHFCEITTCIPPFAAGTNDVCKIIQVTATFSLNGFDFQKEKCDDKDDSMLYSFPDIKAD